MSGRPVKHSLTLKGHRTSVSLEAEFWRAFRAIAAAEGRGLNDLAAELAKVSLWLEAMEPGKPLGFLDASRPGPGLTALLRANASDYIWAAAAVGSNNAAGYQLASGLPVMAVGGFNGTDPAPTLEQFQADVAAGRIHYFVAGTMHPPGEATGSDAAQRITDWVEANFVPRTVGTGSGATTVYDLSE